MRDALIGLTDDFVENNFDSRRCFHFEIRGDGFFYSRRSSSCPGARGFGIYYLMDRLRDVPREVYVTYIAPVDPRAEPIVVYSIYDFERLLALYSPDDYFDMGSAERWAYAGLCSFPTYALVIPRCRTGHVAAATEAGRQVGEALR